MNSDTRPPCINRESKSRPNAGIVTWAHRSFNQRDELVCECTRTALLLKTPK
jgi:acyl dehydratase